MPAPFGEVIASDSRSIEVESHELYLAPAFGSFVRADCLGSGRRHFGVVTGIASGPFDGARIVQAHRLAPGELEARKPHLTSLLRTLFQARLIGYAEGSAVVPGTPPVPPRLHCFVCAAEPEEVRALTRGDAFLRALVSAPDAPTEDLLVCALEAARAAWGSDEQLVPWGKALARLLRRDYFLLEGVLRRLGPPSLPPPPAEGARPRYEEPLPITGGGGDPFAEGG